MNKLIIPVIVGLIIIATAIFNLWIDGNLDPNHGIMRGNRTCEDCHGKHGEKVSLAPKDFNWSKVDMNKAYGIYQMTYNLTCLNETVTLIPQ
jgi:hypothetical protein